MLRFPTTKRHLLVEMPFVLFHIVAFGGVTRSSLRTPDSPFHSRVVTLDIGKIHKVEFANVKGNILLLLAVFCKLFLPSKKVTIGIFTGWYYFHHIVNTLSAFANFFLPT